MILLPNGQPSPTTQREPGGLSLSNGLTLWLGMPSLFKGRVNSELNLVNARGMWFAVGMNYLRTTHLIMAHLGHECICDEAIELVDAVSGASAVLAGAPLTQADWTGICKLAHDLCAPDSVENAKREIAAIQLTGKHREGLVIPGAGVQIKH